MPVVAIPKVAEPLMDPQPQAKIPRPQQPQAEPQAIPKRPSIPEVVPLAQPQAIPKRRGFPERYVDRVRDGRTNRTSALNQLFLNTTATNAYKRNKATSLAQTLADLTHYGHSKEGETWPLPHIRECIDVPMHGAVEF